MVRLKTNFDYSEGKNKLQQIYCKKISSHYEKYSDDILKLVFSAFFTPDIWEDASKVYDNIVRSMSFLNDENPLIFLGVMSQNKITRKRNPIGFFVTDHTIYVIKDSMFSDKIPLKFHYDSSIIRATEVINKAINSFDWEYVQSILPSNGKEELKQLILESVIDILTIKKNLNIEHKEIEKSSNLKDRIVELGLINNSCVKVGDYDKYKKHFKKMHKKLNIPDSEHIQLAITASTLAGPYGMVITEYNIYSKDVMEKTVKTSKVDIPKDFPVCVNKKSIKLGDNIIHTLPSIIDNEAAIKEILIELLNEEINL